LFRFTGLIEAGYFGGCEWFSDVCGRKILGVCERQIVILQFLLDVKLVELVVDRVVWLFGDG
jgi:hypothetical protein